MGAGVIRGHALPLRLDNIDTDQIIAARHLKTLTRRGLGQYAFEGIKDAAPELSDPALARAPIIIAGKNFGCGSSREHAVWAIMDLGVRAVVAEGFSDIFAGNAFKNGLATIALTEEQIRLLSNAASACPVEINLFDQSVSSGPYTFEFVMDSFRRECLLAGLDEIGLTLQHAEVIGAYEQHAMRRLSHDDQR